ncbi:helix-turn-helix transcriptional regulator [Micromonospora sp. STR1s_5]|nr:helix-turn-helix transcriptional regulator [Micromonospora sp. STR1s_5]
MGGPQDIVTEERLFAYDELAKQPFYAEYAHRFGFGWFAGTFLVPDGQASIMLSVERRRERGVFTRDEVSQLADLVPHFQRAGQLAIRMSEARAGGMLDGLETFRCAGALIDGLGRVIEINRSAERYLGSSLLVLNRRISAKSRGADVALQRLIGSVLRDGLNEQRISTDPAVVPRARGNPLIIHAAPIVGSARDLFRRARAILLIVDPDEHRDPAEPVLRQAFQLTAAEIRVSLALLRGQDIAEIATSAQVSEGTVRSQLKSIFAKTGTHRQADLVSLLLRLSGL